MSCLNKSLPLAKQLLEVIPSEPVVADLLDQAKPGATFNDIVQEYQRRVGYKFKGVATIQRNLDKIVKWESNKSIDENTLWNKVQELGVPKDQLELIKAADGNTVQDKVLSFMSDYSYTIEINTAKVNKLLEQGITHMVSIGDKSFIRIRNNPKWMEYTNQNAMYFEEASDEDKKKIEEKIKSENNSFSAADSATTPSSHYAYLTVPGGVNYTENEIATPDITPSITGHAQFSTEKGIGWFRSDDKLSEDVQGDVDYQTYGVESGIAGEEIPGTRTTRISPKDKFTYAGNEYEKKEPLFDEEDYGKISYFKNGKPITSNEFYSAFDAVNQPTKTRRVLEVQSDLFQKGRNKELLAGYNIGTIIETSKGKFKILDVFKRAILNNQGEDIGTEEVAELENLATGVKGKVKTSDIILKTGNRSENQFLQLLNKANNWVTFFVKSIIQDSAKKGYEKVLFPSGNTASKVEGHTTLEQFKKQKEDRIKELEKQSFYAVVPKDERLSLGEEERFNTKQEAEKWINDTFPTRKDELIIKSPETEIAQLRQELERVEKEGFGALRPIYNFYENTVANVLHKQGLNPKQVTDEYGNTWNEVTITESSSDPVYLQQERQSEQGPDENIDNKIKRFLSSIGIRLETVNQLKDREGKPLSGIAVADMLNKIIQVVEGQADITTLPEEAAHFFVEMLGKNSPLYKEMYDKITGYKLYSQVVADYKDNKLYRNPDGSINFDKLKKEAIGKLIMSYVISQETGVDDTTKVMQAQKWWAKAWEFIKNLFSNAPKRNGAIENPFATAASQILNNDTTGLDEKNLGDDMFLQDDANDFAAKQFNKVKADQARITLEPKEHVYIRDGKEIRNSDGSARSVSENVVKPWYQSRFPVDRRSDVQKVIDDLKAEFGTDLHDLIEKITERYIDSDTGLLRSKPLDMPATKFNLDIYAKLDTYMKNLFQSYPAGTRFMSEVRLFNSRKNLPGTTDLLVFLKDGSVDVYDWKSQEVRDDETELKWFKEPAYRLQLAEYTEALEKEYGVLKFNKVRAIPIRTIFKNMKMNDTWVPTDLKNIEIGPLDPSQIPESKEYLLPVVAQNESTGDKMLDDLIQKLNSIYDRISQRSSKDKDKKALELNKLKKTIRTLQIKKDMKHFVQSGLIEVEKYQDKLLNNTLTVGEALEGREIISTYAEGSQYLKVLLLKLKKQIEQETDADVKRELEKQQDDYKTMALNAQDTVLSLEGRAKDLTDQAAASEGIRGILNPERVMDYLKRNFRSLSTLDTAATQMLNRLLNRARQQRDIEIDEQNEKLHKLKDDLETWAGSKGIDKTKMFDGILDGTDFLDIYSKEWMEERKKALKRSDAKWIQDNTIFDQEAYEKAFKKYKEAVESDTYSADPKVDKEKKEKIIIRWIELHNGGQSKIAMLMNKGNFLRPKEQWFSEKYKNLIKPENKPLKDVYDYFQSLLRESEKAGMIDYEFGFIPSMHKTKLEAFAFGDFSSLSKRENFLSDIAVDSANQFGKVDPLSGKPIMEIPVYYTRELGVEKSLDLFKVFGLWASQTANYKAMTQIEDSANALLFVEQHKGSLQTNIFGKVKQGSKIDSNVINASVLENHINYQIYGQKIDLSEDKVVKILGKEVSATRGLQKIMHYFSMKTLAFNPLSGTAALVGGTFNASFIAKKNLYFSDGDWGNGMVDFTSRNTEAYGFLDYIAAELEDTKYHKNRQLSISEAVKKISAEDFFIMQRVSDKLVIYPVMLAMYRSHMVDDEGKIVYIQDYVKKKYDYENIYNLPSADRKALMDKINAEVDELKKTRSLKAKSKIVDGKFQIEGLERGSDEVMKFRNKIKKVNKTIIGNATTEDINQIRMGMMGQIFMQFRSWIPQMVVERFGDMSYDSELDTYNYGKARVFFKHFFDKKFLPLVGELITGYGTNAIDRAKERYAEMIIRRREAGDYNFETRMSEAQFIDMYIANLRSMKRELMMLLAFIGLLAWMKPDDDDKRTPGEKLMARAADKYFNELAFFYNPTEARVLLKSPAPVTGLLEDMYNFFNHSSKQLMGFGMDDEKAMKKAHPAKYFNKMFPGVKVGQDMLAIFDDDFRKEMGLK